MNNKNEHFMRIALELSKKGNPSPNPYVGAVLVKNKKIIGKGFHKKHGEKHAEIEAIESVRDKQDLANSTLYVTLEPCSHYGKTPPCTKEIIKNKIKRVVFAVKDPTTVMNKVHGAHGTKFHREKVCGEEVLKKNGVEVDFGIFETEAKQINEVFFYYSKTKLPFVVLKVAVSKDNKIGLREKRVKITGKKTNQFTHGLRSRYDAILVGSGTVLTDNPRLTSRIKGGRNPWKIILSSGPKIDIKKRAFQGANVTIVTLASSDLKTAKILKKGGKQLIILKDKNLRPLLRKLGKQGITSILVEGGAKVHESFLKQNLVNKLYLFKSKKKKIGKKGIPLFNNYKPKNLKKKQTIDFGKDILSIYYSRT